ncbi:MAG: dienelactone hydrolase family protein [Candidatus Pacearchaeota archaeon]|nr:dienelactone hydrolase family protein [Candidatus Pacearchaeota archaeon]
MRIKKGLEKKLVAATITIALIIGIVFLVQLKKNVDDFDFDAKYSVAANEIKYNNVEGYIARPTKIGTFPGVVMIHEWWGLNENIKEMAEKLASQGYVVLAVDLFNGKVAQNSQEALEMVSSLNKEEAIENMKDAVSFLKDKQDVSGVASLGWCFGGGQSLQLSLNENLDATVIYYGSLVTEQQELSKIESPVLGIFGAEDTSIPVESVYQFETALNELGIENEIYIYDGVGHAFANPSGMNYAPEETKDAWQKTLSFLEKNL